MYSVIDTEWKRNADKRAAMELEWKKKSKDKLKKEPVETPVEANNEDDDASTMSSGFMGFARFMAR